MRDPSKKIAFVVVLTAHAAAIFLVERTLRLQHPHRHGTEEPALLVTFLNPEPPPAPARAPAPGGRRREHPQPHPALEPALPLPVPASAPGASTAITDWRAQGAEAARDIAAGRDRPAHPFGHAFAPAPEAPQRGAFGPKNEHPAGTVEDVGGAERHWVSDNCYIDSDRHPDLNRMPGPHVSVRYCKEPATGGTDMFRQQRPDYLTPPVPANTNKEKDQDKKQH